jgi:hypothetical protein
MPPTRRKIAQQNRDKEADIRQLWKQMDQLCYTSPKQQRELLVTDAILFGVCVCVRYFPDRVS